MDYRAARQQRDDRRDGNEGALGGRSGASSSRCYGLGAPTPPASHGRERTHWIKVHQDSLRR
jgi:hypothetical protein